MMNALTIMPAEHGGFVVMQGGAYDAHSDRMTGRVLMFAGSLADCLEYLRATLGETPPTQPEIRKAA